MHLQLRLFLLAIMVSREGAAQSFGVVAGQIIDTSKGVITNASILLENEANGLQRVTTSDGEGRYVFPSIPIGTYRVTAEAPDFSPQTLPSVRISISENAILQFILKPSSSAQTIEVKSEEPSFTALLTSRGITIKSTSILGLPINGREYTRLSLLVPGAVARSSLIADLTFDGLHTGHNQFSIDGIDASRVDSPFMANGNERGARLLTGSLESIAEFRVETGNYRAQYGRAGGAWINIATKSGSNDWHATLFDFFRNNALDARSFFNITPAPQASFRYSDFGGNLSGPIRHNHTFFFTNYEGSRQRIGALGSGTVPSGMLRDQILSSSPALRPILNMMPVGTGETANPLAATYTTVRQLGVREDTGTAKIDSRFSARNSVYARLNLNDSRVLGPLFTVSPGSFGLLDRQDVPVRTTNFGLGLQHVSSSRSVTDINMGVQAVRTFSDTDSPLQPLVLVSGLTIQPGSRGSGLTRNRSYQAGLNTSLIVGAHSFTWGITAWHIRLLRQTSAVTILSYGSLPDFALNRVLSATLQAGDPGHSLHTWQTGTFFQDTWRIRPAMILDLGIRHDYAAPPYDPSGGARTFDSRLNDLSPPGSPFFKSNLRNFAPRVGLAWQVAPRVGVRSGYGLFFQTYSTGSATSILTNTLPGSTNLLRQQVPDLSYPITSFATGVQAIPSVAGIDWVKPDLYVQHWNMSVSLQISSSDTLQTAYVGNHGIHLRRPLNINLLDPGLGRRPNPRFSNINMETSTGNNNFHALELSWTRRFSQGVQGSMAYRWGHSIDDVQDQALFPATPQDNRNFAAERGNGSGDVRQSASYSVLWQLPLGRGKRFWNGTGTITGQLLSGWHIAALGILRTGLPLTVTLAGNTFGNGNAVNQRVNAVAGVSPYAPEKSVDSWFNPNAFRTPAPGTFGNLGRNTVFGPGLIQHDASVAKDTKVGERFTVQWRAELFNVINHPNFAQPNATFGDPSFGRIFNTLSSTLGIGTARQIQLAIKILY